MSPAKNTGQESEAGYLSFDGDKWEHVEETQKCNVCLKAYTSNR